MENRIRRPTRDRDKRRQTITLQALAFLWVDPTTPAIRGAELVRPRISRVEGRTTSLPVMVSCNVIECTPDALQLIVPEEPGPGPHDQARWTLIPPLRLPLIWGEVRHEGDGDGGGICHLWRLLAKASVHPRESFFFSPLVHSLVGLVYLHEVALVGTSIIPRTLPHPVDWPRELKRDGSRGGQPQLPEKRAMTVRCAQAGHGEEGLGGDRVAHGLPKHNKTGREHRDKCC